MIPPDIDPMADTEREPPLDHESSGRMFHDDRCEICGEELPCVSESCADYDGGGRTAER